MILKTSFFFFFNSGPCREYEADNTARSEAAGSRPWDRGAHVPAPLADTSLSTRYRSLAVSLEAGTHEPLLTNENVIVHRAGVRLVPTATSGISMDTQPGASPAG